MTNSNQLSLECLGQMIAAFIECFKMQQILDNSEEEDKRTFGLYGLKETMKSDLKDTKNINKNQSFIEEKTSTLPDINKKNISNNITPNNNIKKDINIKIDKKCLSCSGQSSMVLQAFKLACLN